MSRAFSYYDQFDYTRTILNRDINNLQNERYQTAFSNIGWELGYAFLNLYNALKLNLSDDKIILVNKEIKFIADNNTKQSIFKAISLLPWAEDQIFLLKKSVNQTTSIIPIQS